MCKFASGIMQYKMKAIWWDMDLDSHTAIMEKFNVKDEKHPPALVKFEMTPKDSDLFNHARENWILEVDSEHSQDSLPDWWDRKRAEDMFWPHLQEIFKERVLIGTKDGRTITEGRWYIKDSEINMAGKAKADLWGTSRVGEMWGTSHVGVMWGTSQVGEMWGTSQVGVMRGTSQVGVMWVTSQVGVMRETSQVEKQKDQSMTVRDMKITVADKRFTIEYLEAE